MQTGRPLSRSHCPALAVRGASAGQPPQHTSASPATWPAPLQHSSTQRHCSATSTAPPGHPLRGPQALQPCHPPVRAANKPYSLAILHCARHTTLPALPSCHTVAHTEAAT
eukprot:351017-Chlamydomonas_euryale.AAC.8